LIDLVVPAGLALVSSALLVGCISGAMEAGRANTCRSNLRLAAKATLEYASVKPTGELPGYINALVRADDFAYHDSRTGRTEPVSWVVMVLPQLDRRVAYDAWRSGASPAEGKRIGSPDLGQTHVYLDFLVCPSDPQSGKSGTPTSYVVNAGVPDYPTPNTTGAGPLLPMHGNRTACLCEACGGQKSAAPQYGPARDTLANGVFFDKFTSSPHFDPQAPSRPMNDAITHIMDPKDRTILMSENVDAVNYTIDPPNPQAPTAEEAYPTAERQLGIVWAPTSTVAAGNPLPTLTPPRDTYAINVGTGKGDGTSYDFSRPSSNHPGGVNIAFVSTNVHYMKDSLSYFVYAKLMTADDSKAGTPGDQGPPVMMPATFRMYQLSDADCNP
jgi:hypothetical protein